jgi:hypothetical protein
MSDYDNTNKGALFQAKEKKTDKHPDYDGSINIDGKDFWLAGWRKTSKNGNQFLSLSIKPKDGTSARPGQSEAKAVKDAFGLDEVPAAKVRGFDADFKDEVPF